MQPWGDRVVRVTSTVVTPDFDQPWQTKPASTSRGTAVVIAPGMLLCAAHLVAYARYVQVEVPGGDGTEAARVRVASHDRDLALLELVDPPDAIRSITPVELGLLPTLSQEVAIARCTEGANVTITNAVVSKIDVVRYQHSQRQLLAIALEVNTDD